MAEFRILSKEQRNIWNDWVETRPPLIKELCARFVPNRLYLLKTTNQRVVIGSYSEDNTLTVYVAKEFNPGRLFTGQGVFGIKPDDLEECDLPGYPSVFHPEDGGYSITFRGLPEAICRADSLEEGKVIAPDVLGNIADFYYSRRRAMPVPSKALEGEVMVSLPMESFENINWQII